MRTAHSLTMLEGEGLGVPARRGGVPARGMYLPREVYLPRYGPLDRILDTRYWKYYLGPTSLRAVNIQMDFIIKNNNIEL